MLVFVRKEIYTKLTVTCNLEVPDDFAANEHGVLSPEHRIMVEDALTGEKLAERIADFQRGAPETQEVQYYVKELIKKDHIASWYYDGGIHASSKQ